MKFEADTHSHTLASGHAYSTIKEMAAAAQSKGLKALALTEHAPEMPGTCGLFYFLNLDVVPRECCGIRLLMGAEVNIMDERAGSICPKALVAIWILSLQASTHRAMGWNIRKRKI